MALNSQRSAYLCLPSAGVKGVCHHRAAISSLHAYHLPSPMNNGHSCRLRVTSMGPEEPMPSCPNPFTMPLMLKFIHSAVYGSACSFKGWIILHDAGTLWYAFHLAVDGCPGCFQNEVTTNSPALRGVQIPLCENLVVSLR